MKWDKKSKWELAGAGVVQTANTENKLQTALWAQSPVGHFIWLEDWVLTRGQSPGDERPHVLCKGS